MQYIKTGTAQQLAYTKTGKGPVLVLIHGFPGNGDMWRFILPVLAASYTVLVPDMPGAGESLLAGPGLTMDIMAADINMMLEAEQVDRAVIAGHSMGGYVAIAFAALYPQRLQGLAMVHSTAAADDAEKKENRQKIISIIQKGAGDAFIKQMVPGLFATGFEVSHAAIVERQVADALTLAPQGMVAFYTAMKNRPDRTGILQDITVPVQWIIGKKDNALPFTKSLQQSHLSNLNFVSIYEDCGHMSMLEDPGKLAADLDIFLAYCYNH